MGRWLFLPDDAPNDLEILAALPPERIQKLRDVLDASDLRLRYKLYVLDAPGGCCAELPPRGNDAVHEQEQDSQGAAGQPPEEKQEGKIAIPPLAFLRSMWALAWGAIRHPFSDTIVDLSTGEAVHRKPRPSVR
jgi:hypothetical protein